MLTMVTAVYPGYTLGYSIVYTLGYSIVYTNGSEIAGIYDGEGAIAGLGPDFTTRLESLGESIHSTILSDLGQPGELNILAQLPFLMEFMNQTQIVSVDRFFALKTFD